MTPTVDSFVFREVLSSETDIEDVLGKPNPKVLAKVTSSLDDLCRAFIAKSPFLVIASSDSSGRIDVSPKGDPAGFVRVLDEHTLAIPERPGIDAPIRSEMCCKTRRWG